MNAQRLLALFEQISEAPDAISSLRRFILELAVRGRLVEQDPGDEPVEEQLERIIQAKILHGRKSRTTKKKQIDVSGETDNFQLPDGWASAPLADLVAVLNGRAYKQSELLDTGTPVLRVGNLFTSNKWYYSDLELEDDKYCNDGDLIFAWSASFGPFVWNGGRVIYHYHIWKLPLHSPSDLSRDYLYLYLLNKTAEIKAAGHGISMVHMTKEKMEKLEVPLPPLAEQHRIVAKVDELMAVCDQLETARQQREQCRERLVAASLQRLNQPSGAPEAFRSDARFALQVLPTLTSTSAQIKQLRQTILNLAVRGKLVEQDPEDEPAVELLQSLQRFGKKTPASAPNGDSFTFALPVGWAPATLGNLVQASNSGWSPKTLDSPRDGEEWGILKVSAVSWERFQPDANKQVLPGTEPKPQAVVNKGDFLISRANTAELVARAVIVDCDPVNLMMSDKIVRLQLVDLCEPRYILIVNNHATFARKYYASHATGVSPSMKNVSRDVILGLPIPLPPLAEQHRIVAKVDELMALCDQLEQQLNQAEQGRHRLLEAVLQEALTEAAATYI